VAFFAARGHTPRPLLSGAPASARKEVLGCYSVSESGLSLAQTCSSEADRSSSNAPGDIGVGEIGWHSAAGRRGVAKAEAWSAPFSPWRLTRVGYHGSNVEIVGIGVAVLSREQKQRRSGIMTRCRNLGFRRPLAGSPIGEGVRELSAILPPVGVDRGLPTIATLPL